MKMTIDEASERLFKHRIKFGGNCSCSQCVSLKGFVDGYMSRAVEIQELKAQNQRLKDVNDRLLDILKILPIKGSVKDIDLCLSDISYAKDKLK